MDYDPFYTGAGFADGYKTYIGEASFNTTRIAFKKTNRVYELIDTNKKQ